MLSQHNLCEEKKKTCFFVCVCVFVYFGNLAIEALVILNHLARIYYTADIKKLNPELEEISQNYEFRYPCKVVITGKKKKSHIRICGLVA